MGNDAGNVADVNHPVPDRAVGGAWGRSIRMRRPVISAGTILM
jgi:hypothetical protein